MLKINFHENAFGYYYFARRFGARRPPGGRKWCTAANIATVAPVELFSGRPIEDLRVGSTVQYANRLWNFRKRDHSMFGSKSVRSDVILLESVESTDSDGLGSPMYDVELLVSQENKVIFDYMARRRGHDDFKMDDYLELRDVTNDGVPEVIFHSGSQGASDSYTAEHVLLFRRSTNSFSDISRSFFFNSGTHGLCWMTIAGRTVAVVADRNWSNSVPLEDRCHYCASPFRYDIYRWNVQSNSFSLERHLYGKKSYDDAGAALDGDRAFVEAALKR
jgi:hypothetical protein